MTDKLQRIDITWTDKYHSSDIGFRQWADQEIERLNRRVAQLEAQIARLLEQGASEGEPE